MKKLPVVGSTAATTSFAFARLEGPDGHLFFDGNSKITAGNGTFTKPQPNALSILNIADCPQRTPTCEKACYVQNIEASQAELFAMYAHNSATIRGFVDDPPRAKAWAVAVADRINDSVTDFRWHVSGDVFSASHAEWIAHVMLLTKITVRHWIYTRSFDLVEPIARVARANNLVALNLSCDVDNYAAARACAEQRGGRLCYLTVDGTVPDDLPDGSVIFPDYSIRPKQFATLAESPWWQTLTPRQRVMVCPVDAHGKSEKNRCGPCTRCLT